MKLHKYPVLLLAALAFASCVSVTKEVRIKPGDAITVNFRAGTGATKTTFIDQTDAGYFPVR